MWTACSAARSSRLRGRVADESSRQNASSHVKNAHARLSGGSTSPHLALAKKNTPHLTYPGQKNCTSPHPGQKNYTSPHPGQKNYTSPHPGQTQPHLTSPGKLPGDDSDVGSLTAVTITIDHCNAILLHQSHSYLTLAASTTHRLVSPPSESKEEHFPALQFWMLALSVPEMGTRG